MKYALMILQALPAIISAMKVLQEFLPAKGQGVVRLSIIKKTLEITNAALLDVWPMVEKVITVLVDAAKAAGVFKSQPVEVPQIDSPVDPQITL